MPGIAATLASRPPGPACVAARRTSATASSMSKGFGRYSKAPPRYAATALSRSEYAVMTMTGRRGWSRRTFSSNFMPLDPGIRTSVISTSGWPCSSAANALSACSKERGCRPPWRNARSSTQRIDASSSTSQTSSGLFIHVLHRQEQREHRPSRAAVEFNDPAVPGRDVLRNGKSQAGPARVDGNQRIENSLAEFGRHAGPVVLELQGSHQPVAEGPNRRLGQRAAAKHDLAALAERLHRVTRKIQHRLHHQVAVERQRRQAGIIVALDRDRVRRFRPREAEDMIDQLVDVDRLAPDLPCRPQQAVHQHPQPVGLADDDPRVLL